MPYQAEPEGVLPWNRLESINENAYTPMFWYADHPTHQAGDPTNANVEAGKVMHNAQIKHIAKVVAAIKSDTMTAELVNEFYEKTCAKSKL